MDRCFYSTTRLLGILLLVVSPLMGQDAYLQSILNGYYDSMGGRAALERIRSVRLIGTIEFPDGTSQTISIVKKRPNKVRLSFSSGNQFITQGYNGTDSWVSIDGPYYSGTQAMSAELAKAFIRNAPLESSLFRGPEDGIQHSLGPDVQLNQIECFQIISTFDDGDYQVRYIEKSTFRERRIFEYSADGELQSEIIPSAFERFSGIDFAMKTIRLEDGINVSTIKIDTVVTNPGSLDSAFDPPQQFQSGG